MLIVPLTQIDDGHAALAAFADDPVGADSFPDHLLRAPGESAGSNRRVLQQGVGKVVVLKQRFDFRAQSVVFTARLANKPAPFGRILLQSRGEDFFHLFPIFRHAGSALAQGARKPSLGDAPIALGSGRRNAENSRGLFDGQPPEEAQLNQSGLRRIELRQLGQRLIQRYHVRGALLTDKSGLSQKNLLHIAAAF